MDHGKTALISILWKLSHSSVQSHTLVVTIEFRVPFISFRSTVYLCCRFHSVFTVSFVFDDYGFPFGQIHVSGVIMTWGIPEFYFFSFLLMLYIYTHSCALSLSHTHIYIKFLSLQTSCFSWGIICNAL